MRTRYASCQIILVGLVAIALVAIAPPGIRAEAAAPSPTVSVGDVAVVEGDAGTRTARVTVVLSAPSTTDVMIPWSTRTASAGPGDYVGRSARARIRPGRTIATLSVRITADTIVEGDERFELQLGTVIGAVVGDGVATVTIIDDDPDGPSGLTIGDAATYEGDTARTPMRFPVTLDVATTSDVTATFAVRGQTATDGVDHIARTGRLRIRAGRVQAQVTVQVVGELTVEPDETVTVTLTSAVGTMLTRDTGTGTIIDDDTPAVLPPSAPTIDSVVAGPYNGGLTALWSDPIDDGGGPVTSFDLEIVLAGTVLTTTSTAHGISFVCGSPGDTCSLRVRAVNSAGEGPWSLPVSGTTWRAPGAVETPEASGLLQMMVATWSPPSDPGDFPILDYRVEQSDDGVSYTFVSTVTAPTATLGCVGEARTCWIRVRARNAAGLGALLDWSATTWARPGPPTLTSIRRVGNLVGLGWDPPADDGGIAVYDYSAERSTDGGTTWIDFGSLSLHPPNCPIGTICTFRIHAINPVGSGPPSNSLAVDP